MQNQSPANLKEYKAELRTRCMELRRAMPPEQKDAADRSITGRLLQLDCYRRCSTLLCYVSFPIEVGTRELIARALADGKRVAAPRCVPGTRRMEFYLIEGPGDLEPGGFGLLEPRPVPERLLSDWEGCLCVVPALACDRRGYRLGYGGGYYDRFLRNFPGVKALILYQDFLMDRIWNGRYDVAVDLIVTESSVYPVPSGQEDASPQPAAAKRPPEAE